MDKWDHLRVSLKALMPDCDCEVCSPIAKTASVILEEMDRLDKEDQRGS